MGRESMRRAGRRKKKEKRDEEGNRRSINKMNRRQSTIVASRWESDQMKAEADWD